MSSNFKLKQVEKDQQISLERVDHGFQNRDNCVASLGALVGAKSGSNLIEWWKMTSAPENTKYNERR